ncbi:MAG TPA: ABC transporter substrate-binding protein [bacterium]|nr:ABC transporter substrate-binding protein [bacterium]
MKNSFKLISILVVLGIIFSGFSTAFAQKAPSVFQYSTPIEYQKATGKRIAVFQEAPQLTEMVKSGKILPVKERLPKEPLVIVPVEEVGRYGGTWRRAAIGIADASIIETKLTAEGLVRTNPDGSKIVPNLAKRWEISRDGRVYTFYLREGLRWSDGEPFTADDITFWFNDIISNKELTPITPAWLTTAGKPVSVEKVDKYVVRFTFQQPNGVFLWQLSYDGIYNKPFAPAHYLKQFHPSYVSKEELKKKAKEAGFNFWYQLFSNKNSWQNTEKPTINAWMVSRITSTQVICERNPYYWKVDTAGNQLPYIDKIVMDIVQDAEILNMRATAGELDMQERHIYLSNYTLFMENREKGNYRVLKWTTASGADPMLYVNQTVQDPVLRKIFQDVRFRQALSLAINREEINKLFYFGLGKPRQASLISQSPYYDPEWEKAYAEYDLERANKLLDEMGLKKGPDSYRIRPDGKTLAITLEFTAFPGATTADVIALIAKYWEKLGIKVAVKQIDRSLWETRYSGNQLEASAWSLDKSLNPLLNITWFVLVGSQQWAPAWGTWIATGGKSGMEPPADIKKISQLWEKAKTTTNSDIRDRYLKEIFNIHKKNLWMIGTVGELPQILIVKNNFRNVPEGLISDDSLFSPANAHPEQFFIKE